MKHQIVTADSPSSRAAFPMWNDQELIHTIIFEYSNLANLDLNAVRKWCYETYGTPGLRPESMYTRWHDMILNIGRIYFAREEDVSLFLLKWT